MHRDPVQPAGFVERHGIWTAVQEEALKSVLEKLKQHKLNVVRFSTRALLRKALHSLSEAGFDFISGLEIEFHVFKLVNPRLQPEDAGQPGQPPEVQLLSQGYQYLTEMRFDQIEPVAEILRQNL